ncbi:MAG: manganese efflux pump [Clostridia bacterium]|nr:manganese efflux pump [Clostridia bacterium]
MSFNFGFFLTNILLGVGLAMDAFSVSVANGLGEPFMKKRKMLTISTVFAFFQFAMPLIGWFCVSTFVHYFKAFQPFIPYIALVLLVYIGGKMIYDSFHCESDEGSCAAVGVAGLILQGIATSIDALSVGFTIATYDFIHALIAAILIGAVTFIICLIGVVIGKRIGNAFAGRATLLGGIILVLIGLEIFITGVF